MNAATKNIDVGLMSINAAVTRMTGQCHKYVPYEIRPRYAADGDVSSTLTGPRRALSIATMSTIVVSVTAMPRFITDRSKSDVARASVASSAAEAATEAPRLRR